MAANVEQAEGDLRRALSILSSTLESTEDGILVLDLEARVIAWNQKLLRIWDLGPADVFTGMPIEEVLHVARKLRDPETGLARFREILAAPAATTRDLLEFADGRLVERYSQPQREGERIVGRVFSFRDVTEMKRFEEELLRSNRELEQFAYVASHDLQEPLRTVASHVQLLQRRYRGKLDADAEEVIGFAVDGAMRMQNLIHALLEFSRVGTRGKPLQPTDPHEVLDGVVENLRATIAREGAQVIYDTLPPVLADRVQLEQLFQNLLTNAIKFRGETPPVVRVTARHEGHECVFSVSDNGIGIPPESRDRVFVIFQRLHPIGKYEGTGIGLAICRKIVERHGGRIWVDPGEEPGATFHFTLPAPA
jgi:PAS domain S-box-containing protein